MSKLFLVVFLFSLDTYAQTCDYYYQRKVWKHWVDVDGDCQNTRAEVLIAHSRYPVVFRDSSCSVDAGYWICPYTGKIFSLARHLDIDHVVPLQWAFIHGANCWTPEKRQEFANDMENLLPVDRKSNREKGSKGITEWLPFSPGLQCPYINKFTYIVRKYNLKLSKEEQYFHTNLETYCKVPIK